MIRFVDPSSRLGAGALASLLALAAACAGGSGSSGFDLRLENRAIDAVLDDGTCVDLDGFIICAADGEGFGGTTPTPEGPDNVATNLDPANQTPCGPALPSPDTDLMLCFTPSGFSTTAVFLVARRTVDPNGSWHLLPAPTGSGDPADRTFAVDVPIPPADAAGAGVQIAVLVFFDDPGPLPERVNSLGATGADFAFVGRELLTDR
jgi:hypothetical protein